MKHQQHDTVGGDNRHIDIYAFLRAGWLPSYLTALWKRINGWNPEKLKRVNENFSFPVQLLIALLICAIIGMMGGHKGHPLFSEACAKRMMYIFCALAAIFAICNYVGAKVYEAHVPRFWQALIWIFNVAPMKLDKFPKDESELEIFYTSLMTDMALLVKDLEVRKRIEDSRVAKVQLECLFKGAVGFGFVPHPEDGLTWYFGLAATRNPNSYRIVDANRWSHRYCNRPF